MPTRFTTRLIALLLPLWMAASAAGQGTSGVLPDPISTRDLNELLTRLDLSQQQVLAASAVHDRYTDAFEQLRDQEIEAFMEQTQSLREGFRFMTEPDVVDDAMRDYDRLLARIVALDDRLFDDLQGLLTEEQLLLLPAAKQTRERRRYRSGLARMVTWRNPASRFDLSDPYYQLDLTDETRVQSDPIVEQYERTLTAESRKLYESANEIPTKLTKTMETLGFASDAMQDRRRRGEMWNAMRTAWAEAGEEAGESMTAISELNRRTYRRLKTVLPGAEMRTLRDEYHRAAYADALLEQGRTERRFDAARKLELTADQLAAIDDLYERMHADLDHITEEMVDVIDADREARGMAMFEWRRGDSAVDQQLQQLRDQRNERRLEAIRMLDAIVGPELLAQLDARTERREGDGEPITATVTALGGGGGGAQVGVMVQRADSAIDLGERSLPRPISEADIADYARRLGVPDALVPVMTALHEDYLAAYRDLQGDQIAAVRSAQRGLWSFDGDRMQMPSKDDVARLHQLRRQARNAIAELDRTFFFDLDVALGDEYEAEMERVRLARTRSVSRHGVEQTRDAMLRFGPGRSMARFARSDTNESGVDVSAIVMDAELPAPAATRIEPLVRRYEVDATSLFARAYESSIQMQEAVERMGAVEEGEEQPRGRRGGRRFGSEFMELMQTIGRDSNETRTELVTANRATIDGITETLGAEGDAIRRAYHRAAFSSVFDDRKSGAFLS